MVVLTSWDCVHNYWGDANCGFGFPTGNLRLECGIGIVNWNVQPFIISVYVNYRTPYIGIAQKKKRSARCMCTN